VSGRPIGLGDLGERLAIIDGHCDLVCSPGRKTLDHGDGNGDRAFTGTIHHKKSEIQKKGMGAKQCEIVECWNNTIQSSIDRTRINTQLNTTDDYLAEGKRRGMEMRDEELNYAHTKE
jgi:hypothetical protein